MSTKIVHAMIDRAGKVINGSNGGNDIEVHRLDDKSYRIIFKTEFMTPPTVTASLFSTEIYQAFHEASGFSEPSQGCIISGLEFADMTTYGFSVFFLEDMGFNFIAIGE
ncbi:hypothetical protein [Sessilibacter corallicola]|uniref:hypothetical protein n=1 Tax=Sessilibacter corallicola TaxID=2904075 RepID=UPI001E33C775|nr:hypothetical protein [Sessilibacter corallicola]MCE2030388.1 hypothetical protein [Sessilibacter corallicola]